MLTLVFPPLSALSTLPLPRPVCMAPDPTRQLQSYCDHLLDESCVAATVLARVVDDETWNLVGRVSVLPSACSPARVPARRRRSVNSCAPFPPS